MSSSQPVNFPFSESCFSRRNVYSASREADERTKADKTHNLLKRLSLELLIKKLAHAGEVTRKTIDVSALRLSTNENDCGNNIINTLVYDIDQTEYNR